MTAREKIEDKLAQLKERQEKKREEERRQKTQDPDYDDDPFNVKKANKVVEVRKKSRSRSLEKKQEVDKEAERRAKVEALKARFKQRQKVEDDDGSD